MNAADHYYPRAQMRIAICLLICTLLTVLACRPAHNLVSTAAHHHAAQPTVILISIDGFRADYPEKAPMPNLHYLIKNGVRSAGLIPTFPSKTFPNHYSIATGLYPAHHGIIGNKMYDPVFDAHFDAKTDSQDSRWWGGEPIWITAEKQGQHSATVFWPGSEAVIDGRRPSYWRPFQHSFTYEERVDLMLSWFNLPSPSRPTFLTMYLEELDLAGHYFGPDSAEVITALNKIDQVLGRLIDGLRVRGVLADVNIMIVSDHGMAAVPAEQYINIDNYLSATEADLLEESPCVWIWPRQLDSEQLYARLKSAHPHLNIFRRAELPARYHFSDHRRIPPLIALADEGWGIIRNTTKGRNLGTHGYDPLLASMHGIFIASGPAFKSNQRTPELSVLDIYNIVANVLQLKPSPNDGCRDCARAVLRSGH